MGAQGQTDGIGQIAGKRPGFQIEAGDELFGLPCGDMLQPAPGDAETAGLELPVGEEGFCGVRQGGGEQPLGEACFDGGSGFGCGRLCAGDCQPHAAGRGHAHFGGFDGQGFDRSGTGLRVKMQAIEGERPYPDGGRTGVFPGLAVGGGKAVAASEGQRAYRGFGTGDGEGGF